MADIYRWSATGPDGQEMTEGLPKGEFPTQEDAEQFLREEWDVYAAEGATAVTLLRGTEVVYGPMSLEPEE